MPDHGFGLRLSAQPAEWIIVAMLGPGALLFGLALRMQWLARVQLAPVPPPVAAPLE